MPIAKFRLLRLSIKVYAFTLSEFQTFFVLLLVKKEVKSS